MDTPRNRHGDVTGGVGTEGTRHAAALEVLRDANEQLVLSSLRSMQEMEAALRALALATQAARIDPLTTLPNHLLLQERFAAAAPGGGEPARVLAVLSVDLDDFSSINEAFGERVGDQLLVHGADVIQGATRSCDTVSRRCCDEFVILLTDVESAEDVAVVARKLQRALRVPYEVEGGVPVQLTASIGVSLYPDHGHDLAALVTAANGALRRAKRRGAGQLVFHGDDDGDGDVGSAAGVPAGERGLLQSERDVAVLRDVNEKLLIAVLSAQELQARAEDGRRRQNEFLAVVAHELRNPLAPMRNVSVALAAMEPADATIGRLQGIIERQVQHMSRLVDDLLDVSRIAKGKLALNLEPVSLDDVVLESVYATRAAVTRRAQHLTITSSVAPVVITGDRTRLVQVVTNLLDNASKYTPDEGQIDLLLGVDAAMVSLTVRDTGIGISPETLPRIFDLYEQEPAAIDFNNSGLGIGLTVVRELVEAHGGHVTAANRAGGIGSEFVVTLPLQQPATPA